MPAVGQRQRRHPPGQSRPRCRSGSRLVARIAQPGQRAQQRVGQLGARVDQVLAVVQHEQSTGRRRSAATTCLQRVARPAVRERRAPRPPPAARARDPPGRPAPPGQTPSAYCGPIPLATSSASRVLPTPPEPTIVNSRVVCRSSRASASSRLRPRKLVSGIGSCAGSDTAVGDAGLRAASIAANSARSNASARLSRRTVPGMGARRAPRSRSAMPRRLSPVRSARSSCVSPAWPDACAADPQTTLKLPYPPHGPCPPRGDTTPDCVQRAYSEPAVPRRVPGNRSHAAA